MPPAHPLAHTQNGKVGQKFFMRFFATHAHLSEKSTRIQALARAAWSTMEVCAKLFREREEAIVRLGLRRADGTLIKERILNCDEAPNPIGGSPSTKKKQKKIGTEGRTTTEIGPEHSAHATIDAVVGMDGHMYAPRPPSPPPPPARP